MGMSNKWGQSLQASLLPLTTGLNRCWDLTPCSSGFGKISWYQHIAAFLLPPSAMLTPISVLSGSPKKHHFLATLLLHAGCLPFSSKASRHLSSLKQMSKSLPQSSIFCSRCGHHLSLQLPPSNTAHSESFGNILVYFSNSVVELNLSISASLAPYRLWCTGW